jgi:catechol 2,3-dioxygenase-like lactoylglutathione lyase family enzyme
MKIVAVAGFAPITKNPPESAELYRDRLGLPLKQREDYLSVDHFPGVNHFGVWPLRMAAQSCFGQDAWPEEIPVPHATIEFELAQVEAVAEAVDELKQQGQSFIHDARLEPWGQTVARFMSPEGVLIGLSYAPWLHET